MPSIIAAPDRNRSWNKMKVRLLQEKVHINVVSPSSSTADDEPDHDDSIMFYL
ncbi:hypothetical protein D3C78_805890 [compost metagenome]